MSGNTFGKIFTVTTFGESHGPALGAVVDGCPPGIALSPEDIQRDLDRRRPGQSDMTTARNEPDKVEILSGVFEGKTTGTPICLLIRNQDHHSSDYDKLKGLFRPGHGDLTYFMKYGHRDHRGGGRSSGRETAARVAAAAIARKLLSEHGVAVRAGTVKIGDIEAEQREWDEAEKNALRCPDKDSAKRMEALVSELREQGDTVGGVVEVIAAGVPPGLGEPVFDKLDAVISGSLMSIGGIKGVEIGDGFEAAKRKGSANSDPYEMKNGKPSARHNRAGGIVAGISNGDDIIARIAVKPTSSIAMAQETIDRSGEEVEVEIGGRHDPCLCPRVAPVAEAMMCLVLCDALLLQRALTGEAGPVSTPGK